MLRRFFAGTLLFFLALPLVAKPLSDLKYEIKFRAHPTEYARLVKIFEEKTSLPDPDHVDVFLFDTPDRMLYRQGVILRLRRRAEDADITVKIRSLSPHRVSQIWLKQKGFKCETNILDKRTNPSCSLTLPGRSLRDLSPLHKKFLSDYKPALAAKIVWSRMEKMGPMKMEKRRLQKKGFEKKWAFERHLIASPQGSTEEFIELSVKTQGDDLTETRKKFLNWFQKHSILSDTRSHSRSDVLLGIEEPGL